jgi:elongation of very long chain fatty acids protein 4
MYAQWDALTSPLDHLILRVLSKVGFDVEYVDPLTSQLPLINKPSEPLCLILAYLMIVIVWRENLVARQTATKASTKIAKQPSAKSAKFDFTLQNMVVVCHNLFLTGLSLYMCLGCFGEAIKNRFTLFGNGYNAEHKSLAWFIYVFYVSKFMEFADTLIMLWKGNVHQVSVLHVYHHASIAPIWWIIARSAPGGEAYWSAGLNSLVHVFMYMYYCCSALKIDRRYLTWAKYLTMFQMTQFVSNMVQSSYDVMFPCSYNSALIYLLFFYMISLLYLFGNFFFAKYAKSD